MSSFQGVGIEEFHCIEVSSFQDVGIEELHCIQRCPHFKLLVLYTGVLISGMMEFISGYWNRGVPLYTEVSSFQVGVPLYTKVSSFQVVGIVYIEMSSFQALE